MDRAILQMIASIALGEKLSKPAILLLFRIEHIFKILSGVVGMVYPVYNFENR